MDSPLCLIVISFISHSLPPKKSQSQKPLLV
jgi:hypothetical protein